MTSPKTVEAVFPAPEPHWVGDGFPVRTIFSVHQQDPAAISPFLLLDYAGPHEFAPSEGDSRRGVDEHPHRGFATVTMIYQGMLEHRDSAGNSGRIGPGDVQWMTAASGVVHEEKHAAELSELGGTLEMIQLWVNLPSREKMSSPRYQEISAHDIPLVDLSDQAGQVRIIAGELFGVRGPADTVTPMNLWEVNLNAGRSASLPLPPRTNSMVILARGEATIAGQSLDVHGGALLSQAGDEVTIDAAADSTVVVLNGEPIDEPVVARRPFVMNTTAEIKQAMLDYQSGKMGSLAQIQK